MHLHRLLLQSTKITTATTNDCIVPLIQRTSYLLQLTACYTMTIGTNIYHIPNAWRLLRLNKVIQDKVLVVLTVTTTSITDFLELLLLLLNNSTLRISSRLHPSHSPSLSLPLSLSIFLYLSHCSSLSVSLPLFLSVCARFVLTVLAFLQKIGERHGSLIHIVDLTYILCIWTPWIKIVPVSGE